MLPENASSGNKRFNSGFFFLLFYHENKKNDLSCKHACAVVSPRGNLKISFFAGSEELEDFHDSL